MANATIRAPRPTGGHAFPGKVDELYREPGVPFDRMRTFNAPGMTLRQYVAAQALAGMLANESDGEGFWQPDTAAARAFEMADAFIAAGAAS